MNFIITKTSDIYSKPCRGAYKDSIESICGPEDIWRIKINSLEQLINLIKKYGTIIVGPYYENEEEMEIEIYDDYRE